MLAPSLSRAEVAARSFLALVVAVGLASSSACDAPEPDGDGPRDAGAAASAEAGAEELPAVCAKLCERTTRCGVELAEREATAAEAELVAKLTAERPAAERACRDACELDRADTDGLRFQLERVQICLHKSSCDELATCMATM